MKTFNTIRVSFAIGILVVMAGVSVSSAQEVTVTYQPFPTGAAFDTNVITGCDSATAYTYPDYTFLFWDNQGTISWSPNVSICSGSTNTVATAWYLYTGGGGNCPPTCFVTTFAFSMDHNEVLATGSDPIVYGTPIALVKPNTADAWTSPSNTVNTNYAESISAQSALAFPPYAAEPFRYWQELNVTTETPIGVVYQAGQYDTHWVVAFYGPDPCQNARNEYESCEEGLGEGGPLKCGAFGKALQLCEQKNREIQ